MHLFEWALDARKTTGGKILAVILSVALIFSLSTWSANAFAEEQVETPSEETIEIETDQPVVAEPASVQEDTLEAASEEVIGSDESQIAPASEVSNEDSSTDDEGDGSTAAPQENTEPSLTYDEATKTLAIMNEGQVTKDMVAPYKAKAKKIVLKNLGTIELEAFAEAKMETLEIDQVEHIGYAFRSCTNMTELTISNVGVIDTFAFYNPAKLKSVSISHVGTIGDNVFNVYNGTTALETVKLEDLSVGNRMFAEHKNLANLSFTDVDTIGFQAFMNCTGLTSLDMNGKVGSLGDSAFYGCTGLISLDLDGVEVSGAHPFYACTGLTSVTVKNADAIGKQAFTGCTGITEVNLENIAQIGENAFSVYGTALPACTSIATVTMNNIGTIGDYAFYNCTGLQNVEMGTVETIGKYVFYNCTALQTVSMESVKTIANFAFWNCENLTSVDSLSNVSDSIGGFSFYNCKKLTGLTVDDAAKMGYVGTSEAIMQRVEAILAGQFKLDQAENIEEISGEEGWDSTTENRDAMWNTYENGTQVVQQARWADEGAGIAEVKVDAYFTAEKQMDYVFVVDLSASMAQLGNEADQNSRFYDMQSKLLDVTHQLLGSEGYDCQVAFVTFGGAYGENKGTQTSTKFYSDADEAEAYIRSLEPQNENTDYMLGISGASGLLKLHNDRNTSVVFLSDGMPNYDAQDEIKDPAQRAKYLEDLKWVANDIKNTGTSIYGVLQSVSDGQRDAAEEAMKAICSEGLFFTSTDTQSFSDAVNLAVSAVYPEFTITIPVGDDFENIENINVSTQGGSAEYDAENNSIVWTINGMPFTKHTLTFNESLKSDLLDRVGAFDYLNNGAGTTGEGATIATGGKTVNLIESTILSREILPTVVPDPDPVTPTDPVQPSTPEQPVTPANPEQPADGVADATGDDQSTGATGGATATTTTTTPVAGGVAPAGGADDAADVVIPDDDNPLAGPDDATIEDDENPLAAFDGPQCWTHIWMIVGIILTVLYGAVVVARRLGYARKIDKIDNNMSGAGRDARNTSQTRSATHHA